MSERQRTPVYHAAECQHGPPCRWRVEAAHPRVLSMAAKHHRDTGHGVKVETFQTYWWEEEEKG